MGIMLDINGHYVTYKNQTTLHDPVFISHIFYIIFISYIYLYDYLYHTQSIQDK
jgi:hypothetical protein